MYLAVLVNAAHWHVPRWPRLPSFDSSHTTGSRLANNIGILLGVGGKQRRGGAGGMVVVVVVVVVVVRSFDNLMSTKTHASAGHTDTCTIARLSRIYRHTNW